MLFNTCINIGTSTSMIHNISTNTLCLLLVLLLFMNNNTLSNIANISAQNTSITPSTIITIETSMVNAIVSPIIVDTVINRCRTVAATIRTTVVVAITTITMIAINTINIILTSTRLLLLLLLSFFINISMSTNPIMTTVAISIITNICVNGSDRSRTTTDITVVMVGIRMKFITTKYCCSY